MIYISLFYKLLYRRVKTFSLTHVKWPKSYCKTTLQNYCIIKMSGYTVWPPVLDITRQVFYIVRLFYFNFTSISSHKTNKFRIFVWNSFSWIFDLFSSVVPICSSGLAWFVRPEPVVVQTIPVVAVAPFFKNNNKKQINNKQKQENVQKLNLYKVLVRSFYQNLLLPYCSPRIFAFLTEILSFNICASCWWRHSFL